MVHLQLPFGAETPPEGGKTYGPNRECVRAMAESSFKQRWITQAHHQFLNRFGLCDCVYVLFHM